MRRGARRIETTLPALLLGTAVWLHSTSAWAGNLDAFYLSGDAAMQGGAITADARGGGATWYNPAGLAELQGTRLDVNINGYTLRFGATADFDPANPNTEVRRLDSFDINVVPGALTLTHDFGDIGIGLGAFVPTQSSSALRTHLTTPVEGEEPGVEFAYDGSERFQSYHLGAALGWHPGEKLALGAALFVNYQTVLSTTDIGVTLEHPDGRQAAVLDHFTLDTQQFGLELVLGGQWAIAPAWNLGLVLRSPSLKLGELTQNVSMTQSVDTEGTLTVANHFEDSLQISTAIISPFRFHTGLSHDFADYRWAVEASLQLPFERNALGIDLRPTWNARTGLRREMGPRWALGGGIFTDRSPNKKPEEFQDTQLDFYGLTAALEFGNAFGTHAKNAKPFEKPKFLVFGTTIALSYALGVGTIMRAAVSSNPDGTIDVETIPTDVFAHELMLSLGSSILE